MIIPSPIQRPLERPSIEVGDPPLRIFAQREGDRVLGRVEFPYEVYGRTSCPIDYRSARPSDSPSIPQPSSLRSNRRLAAVKRYQQVRRERPGVDNVKCLQRVCYLLVRPVSLNTLRTWIRKYELEGESGLRDHYTPRPKKVLTLDAQQATDAVTICAWWIFRIGNPDVINTKMIHAATSSFILHPSPFPLADVLATIDCYYSYPCDRSKMPFKPFARWAKYDFEKWLYRACDANDYRRGLEATHKGRVPLQAPISNRQSTVPDSRTRKRDVNSRPNRQAIRNLAPDPPPPPSSILHPSSFIPHPSSLSPPPSSLQQFGLAAAARRIVAGSAPGIPALCTNKNPQTVAESLGTLDDSYRRMLLSAARGDPVSRAEAVATLPLWWDAMPKAVRELIDLRIETWRREHPRVTVDAADHRKLLILLPLLRKRSGFTKLAAAARIPT